MSIVTKTGDDGTTGLSGGERVRKDHLRIEAYGCVDELNCLLGFALAAGLESTLAKIVQEIQEMLFILGADLATPEAKRKTTRIEENHIARLEEEIQKAEATLPALRQFILPGGNTGAAALHTARAVCRRAERRTWPLVRKNLASAETARFLNRLSDLLFLLARCQNHRSGISERPWRVPSSSQIPTTQN